MSGDVGGAAHPLAPSIICSLGGQVAGAPGPQASLTVGLLALPALLLWPQPLIP
jgi:hypothetical protein